MTPPKEKNRLFGLLCLLIFAAGAFLRTRTLFGALEYDEIWSLENFAGLSVMKIFTELALPNNQPLNSLWIKFVSAVGGPVWSIRLHSLLASLAALPLAGFVSWVLAGKKKTAFLWTMAFLALSAPDIVYASLARGYALQVFFLALFAAGLASCGALRPQKKGLRFLPETAVFAGGAGAVLTLPTSVMYLAAITLAAGLIYRRRPPKSLLAVLGAGAVLALVYCLGNFEQLNAARKWGTPFTGAGDFFSFAAAALDQLLFPAMLLSLLFFLILGRRNLPILLVIVLPLGAAAVTNGGPARAYLPFCAAAAVAAGCAASELSERLKKKDLRIPACLLFAGVLCGGAAVSLPRWRTPDWRKVYERSAREPFSVLVVHRATSGYPLAWNNRPAVYTDLVNRLLDRSPVRELLMFDGPGRINGNDGNNNECVMTIPVRGRAETVCGLPCRRYTLREVTNASPGDAVILAIRPVSAQEMSRMLFVLRNSGIVWLKLNPWLCCGEGAGRYALLAGRIPENCAFDAGAFAAHTDGAVSLYRIVP
ncbi:MAG: hypothetical protein IJU70_01620 [Lentisphaeria bacterium]|nr:hypothetical protein [Lentisphaeria bacterium]